MASLEQQFEAATSAREIPGVVLLASNVDGKSPLSFTKLSIPKATRY